MQWLTRSMFSFAARELYDHTEIACQCWALEFKRTHCNKTVLQLNITVKVSVFINKAQWFSWRSQSVQFKTLHLNHFRFNHIFVLYCDVLSRVHLENDGYASSPTGPTRLYFTMTARCWKVTTSARHTACCRRTTRWTSSTTSPRTTGGQWDGYKTRERRRCLWLETDRQADVRKPGSSTFHTRALELVRADVTSSSLSCHLLFATPEISELCLYFPISPLRFHPESCGLWWWRWCWPQICPATSSKSRPWRTSFNNPRGESTCPSSTHTGNLHPHQPSRQPLRTVLTSSCLQPN